MCVCVCACARVLYATCAQLICWSTVAGADILCEARRRSRRDSHGRDGAGGHATAVAGAVAAAAGVNCITQR